MNYLTEQELAEKLKVSLSTIRYARRKHLLTSTKVQWSTESEENQGKECNWSLVNINELQLPLRRRSDKN